MKRMLTWLTAISLVLTTAGCQSSEEAVTTATATSASAETTSQVSVKSVDTDQPNFVADDEFSTKDYETTAVYDNQVSVTLKDGASSASGDGVSVEGDVITITQAGSYTLAGTLSDGQIVVDAGDSEKVQLLLDGVTITNTTTAAISVVTADKVFLTTVGESTLSSTIVETEDSSVDATVFSKADLSVNGTAKLTVKSTGNGITSKDDLVITSGTYVIEAGNHGLDANNSIRIADGNFTITAQKDGLHCEHDEDASLGYIYIVDGDFQMAVQGDGMDASGAIEIENGTVNIIAGGGSAQAPEVTSTQGGGQMGMTGRTDMGTTTTQGTTGRDQGTTMERTDMMTQGTVPEMTEGTMPGMTEGTMVRTDMTQGTVPEMTESTMPGMTEGTMGRTDMTQGTVPEMTEGALPEMSGQMGTMAGNTGMMGGQMGTMPGVGTTTTEDDSVSTKGIKANGSIVILDGTFTLDTYDDAINSNTAVYIVGGTFVIQTGDDGVKADYYTSVSGGTIAIETCYEGLEGHIVSVSGGDIRITSMDDGINAVRGENVTTDEGVSIQISGGYLYIDAYNAGDGLDSNGTIEMTGGDVLISGTPATTDTSLDYQSMATITGGTFIATGSSSQTRQNFGADSVQGSIMLDLNSAQSGAVTLSDASGNVLVSIEPVKEYQTIHISMGTLEADATYTITAGTETHTITLDGLFYGQNEDHGGMGGMTGGMSGGMSGGRR